TVILGKMCRPSGTCTSPRPTIAAGRFPSIAAPAKVIVPRHGHSTPEMVRLRVDLPAPFAPSTATISFALTVRSTPRKISVAPYPVWSPETPRGGSESRVGIGPLPGHVARGTVAEVGLDDARIAGDRLWCAFREDASLDQHVTQLCETHHRLHDMLDHHDSDA